MILVVGHLLAVRAVALVARVARVILVVLAVRRVVALVARVTGVIARVVLAVTGVVARVILVVGHLFAVRAIAFVTRVARVVAGVIVAVARLAVVVVAVRRGAGPAGGGAVEGDGALRGDGRHRHAPEQAAAIDHQRGEADDRDILIVGRERHFHVGARIVGGLDLEGVVDPRHALDRIGDGLVLAGQIAHGHAAHRIARHGHHLGLSLIEDRRIDDDREQGDDHRDPEDEFHRLRPALVPQEPLAVTLDHHCSSLICRHGRTGSSRSLASPPRSGRRPRPAEQAPPSDRFAHAIAH